jgi:hypothetical protein
MSWGWTIAGSIGELMLALFLFMLVAFSAGGLGGGRPLRRFELAALNLSIYLLPALCVASAGIVVGLQWFGGGAASYRWYALPLVAAVPYVGFVLHLGRRSQHR